MKTLHKINISLCVLCFVFLATSCLPEQESIGDAGQTTLKMFPDGYKMLAIDAISTPQSFLLFEIRRDVANSAQLNTTSTVILAADDAILPEYNRVNETEFIPLPANLGTVSPAISGGQITINFAAGDLGKPITIDIPNSGNFDFTKNYALAFRVVSVSGTGTLSAAVKDTIVCEILAKNSYDGLYLLKGVHNRDPYTFPYETNMQMQTRGASSVAFYWPEAGSAGHPIGVGVGETSWYGAGIAPVIVFDPVTNLITNVYNAGGATVITKFTGAGSNANKYDPATKTIYVSWNYNNNPLRAFFDTLTYIGPR
jgi:hypothetical protein